MNFQTSLFEGRLEEVFDISLPEEEVARVGTAAALPFARNADDPAWDPAAPEMLRLLADLGDALKKAKFKGQRLVVEYLIRVAATTGELPGYRGRVNYAGVAVRAGITRFMARKTGIAHPIILEFAPRFKTRATLFDAHGEPMPPTSMDKLRDWLTRGDLVPSRGPGLISLEGLAEKIDEPYARLVGSSQAGVIVAKAIAAGVTSLDLRPWKPNNDLIEGLTPEEAAVRIEKLKAVVEGLDHVPENWRRKGWADFKYIAQLTGRPEPTMEGVLAYRSWVMEQARIKKTRLPGLLEFDDTVESFRDWGLDNIAKEQKAKGAVTWAREVANQKTNFGKLIDAAGLRPEDEVGDLFGAKFGDFVTKAQIGLVGESAANVRRGLKKWQELRAAKLGSASLPDGLSQSLRVLLRARKMTAVALAHETGVSRTGLYNWASGHASPSLTGLTDIRTIEDFFKLPRDTLINKVGRTRWLGPARAGTTAEYKLLDWNLKQLLPDTAATWDPKDLADAVAKVRPLLSAGTQQGAIIRASHSDEHLMAPFQPTIALQESIDRFVEYKVAKVPYPYQRARHAQWASAASTRIRLEPVLFFYRFMGQPLTGSGATGMGVPHGAACLAWLGHAPMVLAFAGHRAYRFRDEDWDGAKRGIFYTAQEESFVEQAVSMTHPETGWLSQNPQLAAQLEPISTPIPPEFSDLLTLYSRDGNAPLLSEEDVAFARSDWREFLARSHKTLLQALSYLNDVKKVSRNPLLPIAGLFTSGTPGADLLTCIYRSEKDWADARTGGSHYSGDVRNSTMIRLESILNFRPKNLRGLTYLPNNKGQIRKVDGVWEVEVPYYQFKNWKNCRLFGPVTSRRNFHKILKDEAGLYDLLDLYMFDIRGRFNPPGDCPFAFVARGGNQISPASWLQIVNEFGRRHVAYNPVLNSGIPGVASLNPYAFRHIKASDILKNSLACNKVEEAAFALQTSETMIINHYGLLLPNHALISSGETFSAASDIALKRLAAGR